MTKDGSYCGMWQFYQASNIINLPTRSVYPTGFVSEDLQKDLNRTAFPIWLHHREEKELAIMWTPMRMQGKPVHLVPLVKLCVNSCVESDVLGFKVQLGSGLLLVQYCIMYVCLKNYL